MKHFLVFFLLSALVAVAMSQDEKAPAKFVTHHDASYTIEVPAAWKVEKMGASQVRFVGPKAGNAHASFLITKSSNQDKSYLVAAAKAKEEQSTKKSHAILVEKDLSKGKVKGSMRWSRWVDEDLDVVVFVRDVFTESEDEVFILTATFPHTMEYAKINPVMVAMVDSFRFK